MLGRVWLVWQNGRGWAGRNNSPLCMSDTQVDSAAWGDPQARTHTFSRPASLPPPTRVNTLTPYLTLPWNLTPSLFQACRACLDCCPPSPHALLITFNTLPLTLSLSHSLTFSLFAQVLTQQPGVRYGSSCWVCIPLAAAAAVGQHCALNTRLGMQHCSSSGTPAAAAARTSTGGAASSSSSSGVSSGSLQTVCCHRTQNLSRNSSCSN